MLYGVIPSGRRRPQLIAAGCLIVCLAASGCAGLRQPRALPTVEQDAPGPLSQSDETSPAISQAKPTPRRKPAIVRPANALLEEATEVPPSPSDFEGQDGGPDNATPSAEQASEDTSNSASSPAAEGVIETGEAVDPAVLPEADGVTETGDQVSDAISPSAAGATDAEGVSTPPKLPVPTWPLYPPAPGPSDRPGPVVSKTMPDGSNLITLHMDDLDVRKALEVLSRQAGVNILVSPGVSGSVTIDLRDVTFENALQSITKLCNLIVRREGNLIYVSTSDESNQVVNDTSGGLGLRVYKLNYARGADLVLMIKPLLTNKGRVTATPIAEVGIKSDTTKAGGNTISSNDTLLVQDYEWVLKNADRIVSEVDVQPAQVLIEAVILQVTLSKDYELGINYALLGANSKALAVVGSGAAINSAAGFSPATLLTAGGLLQGTPQSGSAVDTQGIKFGFVDKDMTGFIHALNDVGDVRVLATPRLLVLSKQRAEIQLGDRLGFRTLTQTQTSTIQKIEFMNVGTQLRLRPFIVDDGMVRMEIHPEKSTGEVIDNVPSTHTTEVTTNVMVPDGATVVIGGLMDTENEKRVRGIPGLMNLPAIGPLFRFTKTTAIKKELVVLLTPRIWKGETVPTECIPPTGSSSGPIPLPEDLEVSDLKMRGLQPNGKTRRSNSAD